MQKFLTAVLSAALLLTLAACARERAPGDYPAAIMVEGAAYQTAEVAEGSAILGQTVSYTDTWPEKDGETNFSRTLGLPYVRCQEGVAVLCDGVWQLFTPEA